jgi:hypothetical protein
MGAGRAYLRQAKQDKAMELKPETFFIGLIDFFSILLPGAVVAYLAKDHLPPGLLPEDFLKDPHEGEAWAVFLFTSYILGHFVFLMGSKLDDWVYQRLWDAVGDAKRDAEGEPVTGPSSPIVQSLARKIFGKTPTLALDEVRKLRKNKVPEINLAAINTFQWAKARLTLQCPAGLLEVQRFEADSKFFRSLVVVLFLTSVWMILHMFRGGKDGQGLVICLALGFLSLWRYIDRRKKAILQAYYYILTMEQYPPVSKRGD